MGVIMILIILLLVWLGCGFLSFLLAAKAEKLRTYDETDGNGILIPLGAFSLIVVVITYYIHPLYTRMIDKILYKMNGGKDEE